MNVYVVQKGREAGVPAPMNEAIVEVTQHLEAGELKQDPGHLTLLTKHI